MSETELEENWKDKYFKALMDQDDVEKENEERFNQLYKELLRAFGHFRGHEEAIDQAIASLPVKTNADEASIRTLKELNLQIADISDLLSKGSESESQENSTESAPDHFAVARDTLEYFIEQLPREVFKQLDAEKLNSVLEQADEINSLRTVTDEIKNALATVLSERNKKIKELSAFLGSMARRLDGIQTHLQSEKSDRKSSSDDRGDLSKLVGDNLKEIRESVAEAESVDQLQKAIESRIDDIDSEVSSYVESETERANRAEESSSELEARIKKLQTQTTKLRQSLEAARTEAIVDPLTGISNRRAYDERFEIEYSRWKRNHEPLTLAIMDIDHFKNINDTYGHPIGDKVLKVVAGRIQQQVRESDFFGRIGGEEFAFILVNSQIEDALEKVETLRKSVEECNFRVKKKKFQVTISVGLSSFKSRDSIESVYQRADQALVKAKQTGRNKCLSDQEEIEEA